MEVAATIARLGLVLANSSPPYVRYVLCKSTDFSSSGISRRKRRLVLQVIRQAAGQPAAVAIQSNRLEVHVPTTKGGARPDPAAPAPNASARGRGLGRL